MKVIGAKCGYPTKSAKADPTPPAMNPPSGPNISPLIITIESPRLKYPEVAGKGITIRRVVTVVSAMKIAVIAIKTVGFEIVGLETPNTEFEENILGRGTWVSSSMDLLRCNKAN
jgi:hypothetical protein